MGTPDTLQRRDSPSSPRGGPVRRSASAGAFGRERRWGRRRWARHSIALLVAVAVAGGVSGCGGHGSQITTAGTSGTSGASGGTSGSSGSSAACPTLYAAIDHITESASAAAGQSPDFTEIDYQGDPYAWDAFVPPGGSWAITASEAGADMNSTDDEDASVLTESLGPYTFSSLSDVILQDLTDVQGLCQQTGGESQGTEYTADLDGQQITMVLIASLFPSDDSGELRYIYAPTSQWSIATADTLGEICARAVFLPEG